MRVLHLVDRWSDRGGAYRHLQSLVRALDRLGHVTAVAAGESDLPPPAAFVRVPGLEARTPVAADLHAAVAAFRPDLVHLHTVLNPSVLEWAGSRASVITVQDHRYFCPAQGKWTRQGRACAEPMSPELCAACFVDRPYFDEVLGLTQARLAALRRLAVVTLSRYMADELQQAGLDGRRIEVVPPAIDLPPAEGGAVEREHVAILGRLTESKGVRDAVAAWRVADTRLPLVAAGTGPLRTWLEDEGVRVTGWLAPSALAAFLERARAVVMTPRWQEPFGIAGLEALALGAPVAGWRSGGMGEWHPGPLAEWGDVAGVARRLSATLREGPLPETSRAALRARFDPALVAERYLRVYRRAVGLP